MTRDTGLSVEQVEDDDSIHTLCAKIIGQRSGDVYFSWTVKVTNPKVKARFLDLVERKFYWSKTNFAIWEPYELLFKVTYFTNLV